MVCGKCKRTGENDFVSFTLDPHQNFKTANPLANPNKIIGHENKFFKSK